jgi:hypothetical protein
LWGAASLAIAGAIGCQILGGITGYDVDPLPSQACSLPSSGNGRIRLANLATVGASTDFCIRTTGSSSWGRPVFRDGGLTGLCSRGLAYAQVTVPFAVTAGNIDVKAIPAGSTCDATATSQVAGVAVGDSTQGAPVVTVARMFGGSSAEAMFALPEEPHRGTVSYLRIVNALSGGREIIAGLPSSPALPATVAAPLFPSPIAPGHVEPPGQTQAGPIDADGYLAYGSGILNLGVTYRGDTSALFIWVAPAILDTQTLFAIGDPNDPAHVVRGLLCESTGSEQSSAPDGGASVGLGDSGVQDPQLLANCKLTELATIGIDVVDVSLYGTYAPFEHDRRPVLMKAIAGRTQSDIMCVTGAPRLTDEQAIASAGSGGDAGTGWFPYHYYPNPPLDLDAGATDPTQIDGGVPPPPASPPCGNGVNMSDIDSIYSCASMYCSTAAPGDMSGTVQESSTCLTKDCIFWFGTLYNAGPQQNACFDCIVDYLVSGNSFSYGKNECLNDTRQPFYFNGASTTEILSHYPLSNEQVYVLPSTGTRRAVLYAQVQLPDQPVDFYCVALSSSTTDGLTPYVGDYGHDGKLPDGGTENGWEEEQDLQAQRAIAFIRANSQKTGRPAIIAGDWETSVAYPPMVVANLSPEVSQMLGGAFIEAVPSPYVPVCDLCPSPQNAYNGSSSPYDERNVFLYNPPKAAAAFPQEATTQVTLWGTDDSVMLTMTPYETPPAASGPISPVFPRLVRVRRPVSP